MSGCAWVTLATNDTYCLGALVLAHSLKKVSTRHQLAIIITPQVSPSMREQLSKVFDVVQLVDVLDSQDAANLALLQRPDLGVTFTKIHCWNLTQYSRCVFLDADTLVIQNCDELMEREELSAAPDPGWPDCFNSGVFVFAPSQETFKQLIQFASTHGSFDGGDQGLLNMYFNDWPTSDIRKHLSFLYNMCSTSTYTYLPALKYYGANIKIVHFIGANKPWLLGPSGAGMSSFSQAWWDMFQSYVVQHLSKDMSGLAGALGSKERSAIEEQWRKQNWEQGNIDFTGKDSFENIWQKIMDAVNKPKVESPKPVQALVPKEIASQAISEKEKADIPASEAAKEEEKAAEPQEARTPVPEEVKKDIAPLPVASVPAELPKEDQKPLTPEVPKKDQPIPIPPPTPEKADVPKLPESSKPLETLGSSAPDSKEALPSTAEPPKPVELSKTPETLPPVQAAEEPVVQMQAAVAQQPAKVDEPKLDLAGDLPKIEDILKGLEQTLLAEQIKGEQKESNIMPLDQPKIEDILKGLEQTLLAELPKDSKISPLEIPKMPTDISQAPEEQKKVEESQAPPPPVPAQASAPGTPQAPLPEVLKTDAPLPEIPKPETPSSKAPKAEEPKPQAPEAPAKQQSEAPMTPAPLPEAPITPASQGAPMTPAPLPEVPTTPASQPEAPMAPAPLPEVPTTPASQPEAPTTPASQPETPMTPTPLPEALKTPVPKPEVPKTEAPPQAETGASEVPKPIEAPKQSTPEAQKVEAVQPVPVETPLPAPDVPTPLAQTKPETVSAVPAPSETKEVTTESKTDEGKKQKEGQKPAKQQAPQPPPKNGKQKKGQQPEPTSAHPLADAPVQPEAGKEEQKAAPQVPLTPPTSPDSQVKEPEALVKASEPQPGTPIITAPTPPVTPSDAFKVEDPLSAQIKSDETVPATGSSGGADAPVPPKRKGKANEKQPPKPQNNGGKGKGKK